MRTGCMLLFFYTFCWRFSIFGAFLVNWFRVSRNHFLRLATCFWNRSIGKAKRATMNDNGVKMIVIIVKPMKPMTAALMMATA